MGKKTSSYSRRKTPAQQSLCSPWIPSRRIVVKEMMKEDEGRIKFKDCAATVLSKVFHDNSSTIAHRTDSSGTRFPPRSDGRRSGGERRMVKIYNESKEKKKLLEDYNEWLTAHPSKTDGEPHLDCHVTWISRWVCWLLDPGISHPTKRIWRSTPSSSSPVAVCLFIQRPGPFVIILQYAVVRSMGIKHMHRRNNNT